MEHVFTLLDQLRDEYVMPKLLSPGEGETSEFHFGRLTGMLFMLEMMRQQIDLKINELAAEQEARERNF